MRRLFDIGAIDDGASLLDGHKQPASLLHGLLIITKWTWRRRRRRCVMAGHGRRGSDGGGE